MGWIWRTLDAFAGAAVIAVLGIAASESQAFIAQYLRRLGGHLGEAKAPLFNVQKGLRYKVMSETVRAELTDNADFRPGPRVSVVDSEAMRRGPAPNSPRHCPEHQERRP